jgi:hypothetical protein
MPSLLTLSDVMGAGHHAALSARVEPGKIAAVVGDGAVGLCGVIAARRLAERIIMLGRHADRIARHVSSGYVAPLRSLPSIPVLPILPVSWRDSGDDASGVLGTVPI